MMVSIFLCAAGFAFLAWKRLDWALYACALLLPSYLIRFSLGPLPLTFIELLILMLFGVWLIQNAKGLLVRWRGLISGKKFKGIRNYPFRFPIIAWLVVSFMSVGVSGWSLAAFGIWRAYFLEPLLLFIVAINILDSREKLVNLMRALGVSAAVVAVFALYQYASGDFIPNEFWAGAEGRRATSFFPYPNAVGLYLAPIMFMLLGVFAMSIEKAKKFFNLETIAWLLAIVLCLGGIAAARSEGAAFGAAAGLILFGLVANKKLRLITIGLIVAGLLVMGVNAKLRDYALDRLSLRNFSGQVRRTQWRETRKMLWDGRLLSGAGLVNYQATVKPYHQEGLFVRNDDPDFDQKLRTSAEYRAKVWQPLEIYLYPHNFILNFWSELGLAGVIVFIWLVLMFFYYGIRNYTAAKKEHDAFAYVILGLSLSLFVTLVHGIVDVPYFKNDLAVLFWLSFAMMGVIKLWKK